MPWLCLCHFSTFFFSHSDDGEPPVTVKWIIINQARMFPAHEATLCQANKPFGFGLAVFICSGYPWVKSILGTRQMIYLRFLFPSKMCCSCLLTRKQTSSRKVSHSLPCSDNHSTREERVFWFPDPLLIHYKTGLLSFQSHSDLCEPHYFKSNTC